MGRGLGTAVARWAGLGPYYAMFPVEFAARVVTEYSSLGQLVLDPFAGRATSIFAAAANGRQGLGVEINPVGWLYGHVKLAPAPYKPLLTRLAALGELAKTASATQFEALPLFFKRCYAPRVLRFLLVAREHLAWRKDPVDATLMALLLVYLHAKQGGGLSNQMRQGKAMGPDYSVRWWQSHGMEPPDVDPVAFLTSRLAWRYAKGAPSFANSTVYLGDSTEILPGLAEKITPVSLLFTSPPYYGITNYHYDQWLRLWLLGGPVRPSKRGMGPHRARFESQSAYRSLIEKAFARCIPLLAHDAVVYVRADARPFTRDVIRQTLIRCFPGKQLSEVDRPFLGKTQTSQFGDTGPKPGEVDFILEP